MTPLTTVGIALLSLSVLTVCGAVVIDRVGRRRLTAMTEQLQDGRHGEVLASRRLIGPYDRVADRLRSTSALLTGQYERSLSLLEGRGTAADGLLTPTDLTARAGALLGLGRYAELVDLLGNDPHEPTVRHMRAQVAIETGDDRTAERLLAAPHPDADDDAGRQRILGDLLIRRGRFAEGEALVRNALTAYRASTLPGIQVDAGYCHVHLAESAIAQRSPDTALAHLETAKALLDSRSDNAPGFALLHLRRAEAMALAGDATAAHEALAAADELLVALASPQFVAAGLHARGLVALHLGDRPRAEQLLRAAQQRHEALGELPAVHEIEAILAPPTDGSA